ncbi:TonB-dependent receptor [Sediminibacter sp. Hel_I_10]|uniref:TonB-dependent receptor n=1 Tax=Sediminibacter sp. Hel_I_10 TaxID=1392490 RepID=UPI0009DCA073|nr:TonB-dependent receptor [Sediminibacter sp. Hel_I_10]
MIERSRRTQANKNLNLFLLALLFPLILISQDVLKGQVVEQGNGQEWPLVGANVFWLDTAVGAVTDINGEFEVSYKADYSKLIISYVGYKTDTITVTQPKYIKHKLQPKGDLDEVTITSRNQATSKSYLSAQNITTVSSDELLKAACCNLSESFETNPSIDVNFADAVTGTKQIRMLGLTNKYILITTENIPSIRGASQAYGLSFIPGTWVESIQITKGAGSVVNGFESIAGQINTELRKPSTDDRLFVNLYAANSQRLELNTHINTKISKRWDTGLYVHGSTLQEKHDVNNDGFLDMPLYNQINVMNRWQYTDQEHGFVSFINVRYLNDAKQSGQMDFDPENTNLGGNGMILNAPLPNGQDFEAWGSEVNTERFEMSGKFGYVNPDIPWQSLGVQMACSSHNQNSYFGLNTYDINHNSLYSNVIYNSIISDSRHKIKTGLGFTYDHYDELISNESFERSERSAGAFFEYAYDDLNNFTMTAGLRFDTHNLLGEFVTPRLHMRYTPWEKAALRASVGRGKRSANIFAENQSMFSTSRTISILGGNGPIYGLDPEIAWNYGISFLQGFNLFGRKGDVALDFYRTDFKNQVVVDWEQVNQVRFYNLEGDSYANSFQVEVNYDVFDRFTIRGAYKYYDVKTSYQTGKLMKPLVPKHRIFANLSYQTKMDARLSQWKFDLTYNWLGKQRFSSTALNAPEFRLPEYSPTVATLNAQVTKVFSSKFEMYLGGENITNLRQNNPILDANNPFGPNFDTTFVYGPIFGSMYYAGLRYKIK